MAFSIYILIKYIFRTKNRVYIYIISAPQSSLENPQNGHSSTTNIRTKIDSYTTLAATVNSSLTKQVDSEKISWSFMEWLSSVTECMNQKLTFQLVKRKEELVFHVPQKFFQLLKERISCHYNKVEIISPPLDSHGSCMSSYLYKYTWDITDIFNVKQIFDTTLVGFE